MPEMIQMQKEKSFTGKTSAHLEGNVKQKKYPNSGDNREVNDTKCNL